jgi:addiction module RelE/StbE family toxin
MAEMTKFFAYIVFGVSCYLFFLITKRINRPDDRSPLVFVTQFLFCISLWPLIGIVYFFDGPFAKITEYFNAKKSTFLEKKLSKKLLETSIDFKKIDSTIERLNALNYFPDQQNGTKVVKFYVEHYHGTQVVIKVHLNRHWIAGSLFGYNDVHGLFINSESSNSTTSLPNEGERTRFNTAFFRRADPVGEPWLSVFTRDFKKSIDKIDKKIKGRIIEAVMEICESPVEVKGDTQKPLTGEHQGFWRYRIGDYRLVYLPIIEYHKIVFSDFDSRGQIYH